MKKSLTTAGLSLLMATCALSSAYAGDDTTERWPRWYIGLTGDYTYMGEQDVSSAAASQIHTNSGWGAGGSIGYLPTSSAPILNAMRFEAEVTYHENKVSTVNRTNGTSVGGNDADYDSTAYMVNAFYDLPTGTKWSPYIGGGLGMASLHLPTSSNAGNSSSTANEFAYQALVGVGYTPDTIPNTQWSLGYRDLATDDGDFGGASVKYSTSNVELGAKFRF